MPKRRADGRGIKDTIARANEGFNTMRFLLSGASTILLLLPAGAQAPVPVEKESHHRVVLENAYVRVLDLILAPGEATADHTHFRDSLQVMVGPSKMRLEVPGKPPVEVPETAPGEVGFVAFSRNPVTHRIKNVGAGTLRIIEVEFLAPSTAPRQTPFQAEGPDYKQVLDNERARVFRRILRAGESTNVHTHQRPLLGINVTGGTLLRQMAGQPPSTAEVAPASISWPQIPFTHSFKNVGKTTDIAIDVELK
jgi:quercetin dioxygenase-like cupin family protein